MKEFQWTNPPSWLQLNVVGGAGAVEEWAIEMIGLAMLMRHGGKRNTFNPRDKVTVTMHPMKAGTYSGDFQRAILSSGKRQDK